MKETPEFRQDESVEPEFKSEADIGTSEKIEALQPKEDKDLVDRLSRSFARSDRAQKLALPKELELLIELFNQFETNLQMRKKRSGAWQTTFDDVSRDVEGSFGRRFDEDRFRQILRIVPDFYLHRWDQKQGKAQLFVDIPKNISQVLQALQTGNEKELARLREEHVSHALVIEQ